MDGGLEVQLRGEQAERKISAASSGGSSPLINGGESPHIESLHPPHRVTTNGHSTEVRVQYRCMREEEEGREGGGERSLVWCSTCKTRRGLGREALYYAYLIIMS